MFLFDIIVEEDDIVIFFYIICKFQLNFIKVKSLYNSFI